MSESKLRLYNTLTRSKEDFVPIDPANVRMYVCGPTVYDFAHIGNARPAIVFDVLFRLLRHLYGEDHVTYVRNITDVDDKINARALRDFGADIAAGRLGLNEAIRKVTEKTDDQYQKDVAALGCLPPTFQPRATEFVQRDDGKTDMIDLGFAAPDLVGKDAADARVACEAIPSREPVTLYLSADDSNSMASPAIARRMIRLGRRVPAGIVRTYEFLNYYNVAFEQPTVSCAVQQSPTFPPPGPQIPLEHVPLQHWAFVEQA